MDSLDRPRAWWEAKARREGDVEVGAGGDAIRSEVACPAYHPCCCQRAQQDEAADGDPPHCWRCAQPYAVHARPVGEPEQEGS